MVAEISTGKPYIDRKPDKTKRYFTRTFDANIGDKELIWHRDKKDRTIKVISGVNWRFQHDNDLPFEMKVGDKIKIKKETYHRIHKGFGKLIIEIEEHD